MSSVAVSPIVPSLWARLERAVAAAEAAGPDHPRDCPACLLLRDAELETPPHRPTPMTRTERRLLAGVLAQGERRRNRRRTG